MKKYEITGYIMIPVSVEVEAENVSDALEAGAEVLEYGGGEQGQEFVSSSFKAWNEEINPNAPVAEMDDGVINDVDV